MYQPDFLLSITLLEEMGKGVPQMTPRRLEEVNYEFDSLNEKKRMYQR
jgi:hypothetical protein